MVFPAIITVESMDVSDCGTADDERSNPVVPPWTGRSGQASDLYRGINPDFQSETAYYRTPGPESWGLSTSVTKVRL